MLFTVTNQIYLVTLRPRQLTQASFLQKNQTLQNVFLISVMQRWHRASVACKNQRFKVDYFILPLFLVPKLRSVAQNEWKKHPYIFFFYFWSKLYIPSTPNNSNETHTFMCLGRTGRFGQR